MRISHSLRRVMAVLTALTAMSVVTASMSRADTVGDHWVDNIPAGGTTAAEFGHDAGEKDCQNADFLSGNYDLWHFVINQVSDPNTALTFDTDLSTWASPAPTTITDVTSIYGPPTRPENTKLLWIATSPPGARLTSAYLNYDGTAARENLSHACAHSGITPGIKIDPIVKYDMTWDWTVDKAVDWSVNPGGGYNLDYHIEANRSSVPRIVPGSLHVTDSVVVTPPELEITALRVSFTQGTYTQTCATDLALRKYDCTLDVSKISVDPTTGKPTGSGTLYAEADYSGGTLTDSLGVTFDGNDPTTVYAQTASISDDNATPGDSADDRSTSEDHLNYSVIWMPSGSSCNERTNTALLTIDNPPTGMTNPSDSVTVRWCPPLPGRTIGYWGNKTGAPLVVDHFAAIKAMYPAALSSVSGLTTNSAVANFFKNASCSGDCKSMFAAQFLAVAMNALNSDFASQGLMVLGECKTVAQLLAMANAGASGANKTWYEKYKSILDDVNNSRQTSCVTVID